MNDEERALELEPKPTVIEDRPIVEVPGYARVKVAQAHEIDDLSVAGWVMIKAVPMDQVQRVNKTWPYSNGNGSYPSDHSYSEETVTRQTAFLMGCPRKLIDAEQRAEIDRLGGL